MAFWTENISSSIIGQPGFSYLTNQAALGFDTVDITDVPSKYSIDTALKLIHTALLNNGIILS